MLKCKDLPKKQLDAAAERLRQLRSAYPCFNG